jgi:hypothetical protein
MIIRALLVLALLATGAKADGFPLPQLDLDTWKPLGYLCGLAESPPQIDGRLDDAAWAQVDWTADFVDITGDSALAPRYRTRAKLLWDSQYLYIGADLEEPHLWASLTERDAVIYHDNDFEVFIDPDGDTHDYYELEINALGTVWDLLLTAPYRDGGHAVDGWDIAGLKSAVHLDGTLNDPSDIDRGWNVELALPWRALEECAAHSSFPDDPYEVWRINFSRVQWTLDIEQSGYRKRVDAATGAPLAEDNWVWSPQGLVAMHYPELWGFVCFSQKQSRIGIGNIPRDSEWPCHPLSPLRLFYYAQRRFHAEHGYYCGGRGDLPSLTSGTAGWKDITWTTAGKRFLATQASGPDSPRWTIDETGRFLLDSPGMGY